MLFTEGLIKIFVLNLRLFNFVGSYLYEIDPVSYKLKFNNSKSLKLELILKGAVAGLMYLAVIVQLIVFGDRVPSVQLYEGVFFVGLTYGYIGSCYVFYTRSTETVELFNSLVQLEQQLIAGGFLNAFTPKRSFVSNMKSFQACAIYTPVLVPCLTIRFWLHPCEPYAPGFWILEECSHVSLWDSFTLSGSNATLYWACICLLLTWSLSKLIANHFFVNYQFVFLIAACIRVYLDNILAHIGNGRKEFSTLEMIQNYKKIQLMMRFFNKVNQDIFIPILLFLIGVSYVIPSFTFLTVASTMSAPQSFIMGSASYQVVICLFVGYGIFGGIYDDSIETLHAFRATNIQIESKQERKLCAKLVRSLRPIKVMIGSVNYIDKLAPITMSDFFLGILVNLLLLR